MKTGAESKQRVLIAAYVKPQLELDKNQALQLSLAFFLMFPFISMEWLDGKRTGPDSSLLSLPRRDNISKYRPTGET